MMILHDILDVSDNILGPTLPGKIDGTLFNYVMFYAWVIGNFAFIGHTAITKPIQFAIILSKIFVLPAVYLLLIYAWTT